MQTFHLASLFASLAWMTALDIVSFGRLLREPVTDAERSSRGISNAIGLDFLTVSELMAGMTGLESAAVGAELVLYTVRL
jgi:hypothetical protein